MLNLPWAARHMLGPLILSSISCILFFLASDIQTTLIYDRIAVSAFELWRLITGNLLHTNGFHLILNITGLIILWMLHGDYYSPGKYLSLVLFCGLVVTSAIFLFTPERVWYVGLSGALHGVFAWGIYHDIRRGMKTGWVLLAVLIVKIASEQIYGANESIAELINANVAIESHLYGAIAGLFVAIMSMLTSGLKKR
ncbi:rhombosortase [Paraneptunicella aestuarii]|uniref:rhombosortase n=1 Tax=Paraneptunicella aestuarii TaxID=2831148 RepID=UPI001E55AF81|nr:rhombosortase [Paraneptunicella aestuarii]UAA40170.1 rhombosortase [Paraneptunicella aestuarii]